MNTNTIHRDTTLTLPALVALVTLAVLAAREAHAQVPISLDVQTPSVTGTEAVHVTLRAGSPARPLTISIVSDQPDVVPADEATSYEVPGELTVELATLPVSEATTVTLTPVFQNDTGVRGAVLVLAPVVSAIAFASERVPGGFPAYLEVSLNAPTGDTGTVFELATDDGDVVSVPEQGHVEPGSSIATIPVFTSEVESSVTVNVTVTHDRVAFTAPLVVDGLQLIAIALARDSVAAGELAAATVTIGVPAPAGGIAVALTSGAPELASVPAEVVVPEGAREASFIIETALEAQDVAVAIFAELGGVFDEVILGIDGAVLAGLALSVSTTPGGLYVEGRVTLDGFAPPEGVVVELTRDNPDLASVPETVSIGVGENAALFRVTTARVVEREVVSVRARYGAVELERALELTPEGVILTGVEGAMLGLELCLGGPDNEASEDCAGNFDFDPDTDVDMRDFAIYQVLHTNVLVPAAPSFAVDPAVTPALDDLPSFDGEPRRLAAVRDASGVQAEFVEDEVIVETDSEEQLADFLERWEGTVLFSFSPADFGFEGTAQHLVRIRPELADPATLDADLLLLDPFSLGQHAVSNGTGHALLAAAAREAAGGLSVGVNWVARPSAIRDRTTAESPTGPSINVGPGASEAYSPNAGAWSYLRRGGVQDIGVIEAWRVLESLGRFQNKMRIAILDRGFSVNNDWPAVRTLIATPPLAGVDGVGDGNCADAPCPWHATASVCAAAGVPDDMFGAAGPAGPVAEIVAVRCGGDLATTPVAMMQAALQGVRIINMSFSASVPATLTFSVLPFDAATRTLRSAGLLIFAAAGNDNLDVDRESCFLACWESAWHTPCENGGVTCVGALAHNSRSRASYSNHGGEDVDLFGPGTLWTSPVPGAPGPQVTSGTSEASPFVAGVAALVWTANPFLSADAVEDILRRTSWSSPDGSVRNYVSAYRAVIEALGGNEPPYIRIVSPRSGGSYSNGFLGTPLFFQADASDKEDGVPEVRWTSDRDGAIGNGLLGGDGDGLSVGTHIITATATDRHGAVVSASVTIQFFDPAPTVAIREPLRGTLRVEGEGLVLRAATYDPDGPGFKVAESGVKWTSNLAGTLGTGHRLATTLRRGTHLITVTATDAGGSSATDSTIVTILEPPPAFNPPPVASIERIDWTTYYPTGLDELGTPYTTFRIEAEACDPEFNPCRRIDDPLRFVWTTDRVDLQPGLLLIGRTGEVRLYGDPGDWHEITLRVPDPGFENGYARSRVMIPIRLR